MLPVSAGCRRQRHAPPMFDAGSRRIGPLVPESQTTLVLASFSDSRLGAALAG